MSNTTNKNKLGLREKKELHTDDGEPTKTGVYFSPAVDIYETGDAITLLADLPGVEKEKLDINVEDKQLTITGLVGDVPGEWQSVYDEYRIGGFTRSFKLGDTIDQSKIDASLKDGVLTLVLPKAERLKPRRIEVQSS